MTVSIQNGYVDLPSVKTHLNITDTTDDTRLGGVIQDVSRWIEDYCHRWFYPRTMTVTLSPDNPYSTRLGALDLLAVSTLATDTNGDRTFETTWTATDYRLLPINAAVTVPRTPYWEIAVDRFNTSNYFPLIDYSIQLTGRFGFYEETITASATVGATVSSTSALSVTVSSESEFGTGNIIVVDSEQMNVTATATNLLTVERGKNGTTAATHSNGAAISILQFPEVSRACLLQVARIFGRKDTPYGASGAPDFGQTAIITRLDPDVQMLLWSFRHPNAV